MADKALSDLADGGRLADGDIGYIVRGGDSRKATLYEEGAWTPVLTFATPGDLVVAYSSQQGIYSRIGSLVVASFEVITSSFTHTTASGNVQITGFPFANASLNATAAVRWTGVTKANYTDLTALLGNASDIGLIQAHGSGQSLGAVTASDMPSGGTPGFRATLVYRA